MGSEWRSVVRRYESGCGDDDGPRYPQEKVVRGKKVMVQMCATWNNSSAFEMIPNIVDHPASSARQQSKNNNSTMLLSPELFIGLELSIVPQVERVYVDRI